MTTIHLEVPDEILWSLKEAPEDVAREIRMAAAAKLYEIGKLSSGRAAQLVSVISIFDGLVFTEIDGLRGHRRRFPFPFPCRAY